jgi:hypothetical protein
MANKLDASRKRFVKLAKKAVKDLKSGARGLEKAQKQAVKSVKSGVKSGVNRLEKAQRKGSLAKWRNTIGLGIQAIEMGIIATQAIKLARAPRKPAKKRARSR